MWDSPPHQFIYTSADASRLCRNDRSPAIVTRRLGGCRSCAPAPGARTQALPAVWWSAARSRPGRGGVRSSRLAGIGRLSGSVLRGAGRSGRRPMAGEASGAGRLGGRSPGLRLAAAVLLPPQEAQGNPCGATSRAGRTAPSPLHAMGPPLDIALLRRDWGRAGRRKQNQKLQRPAA
jgi:hypothetical protein